MAKQVNTFAPKPKRGKNKFKKRLNKHEKTNHKPYSQQGR
jgi:hypothetical protein